MKPPFNLAFLEKGDSFWTQVKVTLLQLTRLTLDGFERERKGERAYVCPGRRGSTLSVIRWCWQVPLELDSRL